MEETILADILKQTPLAGLLGYFLKIVWDKYQKEQEKKDALADIVVKTTLLWEERYSKETQDDKDIRMFMQEIRDFVKDIKNGKTS